MDDNTPNLVTLERHLDYSEGLVVQSLLAAHGLPAVLPDDYFLRVQWTRLFALGGARIQVPRSAAQDVRILLQSIRQENEQSPLTKGWDWKRALALIPLVLLGA